MGEKNRWLISIISTVIVTVISTIVCASLTEDKAVQIWIGLTIALISFIIIEHIQYIIRQDKYSAKAMISHMLLDKFLNTYSTTHDKEVVNKMLSSFEDYSKLYKGLGSQQRSFVEFLFGLKFVNLYQECFVVPQEDEYVINNIPKFYFEGIENKISDNQDSIWGWLIKKTCKYRSFQLLTEEMANIYCSEGGLNRLDREYNFIDTEINNNKEYLRRNIFKKIIVIDDNFFTKCNITMTYNQNFINSCASCDFYTRKACANQKIIDVTMRWMKLNIPSKHSIVKYTIISKVNGLFGGNQSKDFGIFDDILGIQKKFVSEKSPINGDMRCDFYFEKGTVDKYRNIFDNILKEKCNS
jgi:hypothetical protein